MDFGTWQVQIHGWPSDLEHLVHHFTTPNRKVVRDTRGDGFVYETDSFIQCQTSENVLNLASEDLRVLSGVLKLIRDSPEPLRVGAVYRLNANGGRDAFVSINETVCARAELGEVTVSTTGSDGNIITRQVPPPRTIAVANLSSTDANVAKALRLLAAPDHKSWVNMYRIHEVIELDVGGEHALIKKRWGLQKDLKRFKHSANSVEVAGDDARHGKEENIPPPNPMSIEAAAEYLMYVLQTWIAAKGA